MEYTQMVFDLINLVPNVIWAAIIASVLTLAGVLATNINNNSRLTKQLEHEGGQRDKEREIDLRREVYLGAAEAIAEAHGKIVQIPNYELKIIQDQFSNLKLSAALNKVHIVSSERTVSAISSFGEQYAKSLTNLMTQKLALQILEDETTKIQTDIDSIIKMRDEILEQIQEIPKTEENSAYLDSLFNKFKETELPLNSLFVERDNKGPILSERKMNFQQECLQESFATGKTLIEANLAIRQELHLPINEEFYSSLMLASYESAEIVFNKYIENITVQLQQ